MVKTEPKMLSNQISFRTEPGWFDVTPSSKGCPVESMFQYSCGAIYRVATLKSQKILDNSRKFQKILEISRKFQKTLGNSRKPQEILQKPKKILKNPKKSQNILGNSRKFQEILENRRNFYFQFGYSSYVVDPPFVDPFFRIGHSRVTKNYTPNYFAYF